MATAASIERPENQNPQPHAWPRVAVRPAVRAELSHLHDLLAEQADYFEQNPIDQSIVFVAEYGGDVWASSQLASSGRWSPCC